VLLSKSLPALRVGVRVADSLFERFFCLEVTAPSASSPQLIPMSQPLQGKCAQFIVTVANASLLLSIIA
jgi:hypothetical protein